MKSIYLFQENYEDGVLILINKNWQDLQQGLGKILEGLEKHDKLQDVLITQYEDVHKLHEMKTQVTNTADPDVNTSDVKDVVKEEFVAFKDDVESSNLLDSPPESNNYFHTSMYLQLDQNGFDEDNIKVEDDFIEPEELKPGKGY